MATSNYSGRRVKLIICSLCGLWLFTLTGCGSVFKVAPLPKTPSPDHIIEAASGSLSASAALLKDDERSFTQFGANLPLAGIIAVEVQLTNRANQAITPRALKFELRDTAGANYKQLAPKKALDRLMKFYGKSSYVKDSYQQTRDSFELLALPVASALEPQKERRGFIFFEAKRDVLSLTGLTLSITGGSAPIKLKLNEQ